MRCAFPRGTVISHRSKPGKKYLAQFHVSVMNVLVSVVAECMAPGTFFRPVCTEFGPDVESDPAQLKARWTCPRNVRPLKHACHLERSFSYVLPGDVGVSLLKGGCLCHASCMPPGTIFLVPPFPGDRRSVSLKGSGLFFSSRHACFLERSSWYVLFVECRCVSRLKAMAMESLGAQFHEHAPQRLKRRAKSWVGKENSQNFGASHSSKGPFLLDRGHAEDKKKPLG